MFLVVGLGNPGDSYKKTRHNAGFIAVDFIADDYNLSWSCKDKFNSHIALGIVEGYKVILSKPTTFMNLSGKAVSSLMSFYKIDLKHLLVIHDDIDLQLGQLKHKIGGSSGGHNGLKSINNNIGLEYRRIRVGVGRPEKDKESVSDYVLGDFSDDEMLVICQQKRSILQNVLSSFDLSK